MRGVPPRVQRVWRLWRALAPSRALAGWRVIAVRGTDARAWLQDLVTADVEGMPDRRSLRSLLLTPTGRIRADFHVAAVDGSFLLLQAPEQPEGVDAILRPYVLSSDVQIEDRTDGSTLVAVLGDVGVADGPDPVVLTPSVAGPGSDVVVATDGAAGLIERLRASGLVEVDPNDLETWRIRRGVAADGSRFRTGRLAGRGRSRGRDRLHEGMLPRAGIRCQGPQPRSSTPGAPARPVRRAHRPRRLGPRGRGVRGRGDERGGLAPRRRCDRPNQVGCSARTPRDRGRTTRPTERGVDSSAHFVSATWGFARTRPPTPSPPWSLRAIPVGPGPTGTPGRRTRNGAHRSSSDHQHRSAP